MPTTSIESLFGRKGIWRAGELTAEGVQYRDLVRALEERVIVRPVFSRNDGPVAGIYVSRDLDRDSDRALIVASYVTGGVIGRHTAGFKHGLTTDLPRRVEVHVRESYSRVPPQLLAVTMRSRNENMRRVGVEDVDTEFGVSFAMTNPARTVVDILHSGRNDGRDYEHGLEALGAFLSNGGEPGEITGIANDLGLDWDDRISLSVNAVHMGMGSRRGP